MRKVRGAKALSQYFSDQNIPMSERTIYNLMRQQTIPFRRISGQILIFDLDDIDAWLNGDKEGAS
ncbi:MAG: helix-turn-helix domain-containing protein [Sporolactobacillus sp.]